MEDPHHATPHVRLRPRFVHSRPVRCALCCPTRSACLDLRRASSIACARGILRAGDTCDLRRASSHACRGSGAAGQAALRVAHRPRQGRVRGREDPLRRPGLRERQRQIPARLRAPRRTRASSSTSRSARRTCASTRRCCRPSAAISRTAPPSSPPTTRRRRRQIWAKQGRRRDADPRRAARAPHSPHLLGFQPVRYQFRADHDAARRRTARDCASSPTSAAARPAPPIWPAP